MYFMSDLLQKHPEIKHFETERKILSPEIKNYLETFQNKYPKVWNNLSQFRKNFSQIDSFDEESVKPLQNLQDWTFSNEQQEFSVGQLTRIVEKFPAPKQIRSKIVKGMYLDLRDETDNSTFAESLKSFANKVVALNKPEKIEMDISQIGRIPVQTIHEDGSQTNFDPMLESKVRSIKTFDVTRNPGLSIKDVIAVQMIQDAIDEGKINENSVIVEGTSGNTGAAVALMCLHFGLKCVLTIPSKMSQEKMDRLRNLGAHVIVTPTKVTPEDVKSYYSARDKMAELVFGWAPIQYHNLSNRKSHESITGPQIWEQTKGKVDVLVATAGTCGTVCGIARYLKSKNKNIMVIAVDTVGSILYLLKEGYSVDEVEEFAISYLQQGFGEDFYPQNLDLDSIDNFVRSSDADGLNINRILPSLGFIQGQSSGAAYAGVIKSIEQGLIKSSDNVFVIFPDYGIPYRKDVYNDIWMEEMGLI